MPSGRAPDPPADVTVAEDPPPERRAATAGLHDTATEAAAPDTKVDGAGTAVDAAPEPVGTGPAGAAIAAGAAVGGRPRVARRAAWPRTVASYAAVGAIFLGLSVGLWADVWTGHPTTTTLCGCGDPALFLWFFEWPAYALAHGHSPFYSSALFHPGGIDLLSNTSVLAIGVPLIPVTWAFGPVASLDVALTATPVLTGLAMFWLLRRWVRWTPAAFAGALVYAFSPFVLDNLSFAHLMDAALAPIPLIVGCLDELLLRHRWRPIPVGIALGLLVAVEFFVSTEMLVMLAIAVVLAVAVLVGAGLATGRHALVAHARKAWPGLVAGAALTVVLLAYPVWYALVGRAHLSGSIWPNLVLPAVGGDELPTFVRNLHVPAGQGFVGLGGYLGRPLPGGSYLGWGLLAVPAAALALWWRDRRLWFFGTMAVLTGALSLGVRDGWWQPWRLFDRLPVVDNVIQQRFIALTLIALCAMWAVALDRASRLRLPLGGRGLAARVGRASGAAVAVGAATAAVVVPLAVPYAGALPFAVRSVDLPAWFAGPGRHLPHGTVLLAYPPPFSGIESAMAWQAVGGMGFAQVGGGGPEGIAQRAGAERPGFEVLARLGFGFGASPSGTPSELAAVRNALRGWGVTTVVVARQRGLVPPVKGRDPWYAAAFLTAALGRAPTATASVWVWRSVDLAQPAASVPAGALGRCSGTARSADDPGSVGSCVLAAGGVHG